MRRVQLSRLLKYALVFENRQEFVSDCPSEVLRTRGQKRNISEIQATAEAAGATSSKAMCFNCLTKEGNESFVGIGTAIQNKDVVRWLVERYGGQLRLMCCPRCAK